MSEWKEALPEELQSAPYFKNAESIDQVLADLKNASQYMGNSVKLPGEGDDLSAFKEKLSSKIPDLFETPEAPDFSQYEAPAEYRHEGEVPQELTDQAKALGLSQVQFESLVDAHNEQQGGIEQQQTQYKNEQELALREHFGAQFDSKMSQAMQTLLSTGAPAPIIDMVEAGTADAQFVTWLDGLSSLGTESANISRDTGSPNGLDYESEIAQIDSLMTNGNVITGSAEYGRLIDKKVELLKRMG
ncbi:MAG: hypothetical protein ABJN62_09740 [Halioglobus sp.]